MAKAKGWRNNRSDIPDDPGTGNPDHPNHDEEKPKRKRQKQLPGLEQPSIPRLEELADRYVERRQDRMAKLQEEIAARDLLEAAMREAGLKHYEYDGKIIDFVATEKIKVKTAKDEEKDEEDGDE